jgi:hypothetical protein
MKRYIHLRTVTLVGIALLLAGALFAQNVAEKKLLINGKAAGTILQSNGHSYVDIDTLAKLLNGTISFEPEQVVLTIPPAAAGATSAATSVQSSNNPAELSKGFVSAAIGALAEMREWKGTLETMVTYGLVVSGRWAQAYREHAETSLSQASVAASTSEDHEALQLLNNQYNSLAQWAGGIDAARQSLNGAATMDPDALQNDPELGKISKCDAFLSSMLVSRAFADDASCD